MSLLNTSAFILGSHNIGEADKIITFFTLKNGKVKGAANGVRKPKNRFGSSLEPFTYSNVILFEKRKNHLYRIKQSSIIHSFQKIRDDIKKIVAASRIVNLVKLLTIEGEVDDKIFQLLLFSLSYIEKEVEYELITRIFEIKMLNYSGYRPSLDRCLKCNNDLGDRDIYLSNILGGTICSRCADNRDYNLRAISRGAVAFLNQADKMKLSIINRLKASPRIITELKEISDFYIPHFIGRVIPDCEL
ncbi:MAG: DNA repair protein RecO [Nitrospirota bacterium]